MILLLKASSTGRMDSSTAGSAPTSSVSVPPSAANLLPASGASTHRRERSWARPLSSRIQSSESVLHSTITAPGRAPASAPSGPSHTAREAVSSPTTLRTTSACAAAAVMTADKAVTKMKEVRAHELYAFALVPEELLEDAPRLADRLSRKAPAAIRWKLIEAFVTGTGAGQPLGWNNTNRSEEHTSELQ